MSDRKAPGVALACDALTRGAESALTLIHRNISPKSIGMRVSRDFDPILMAAHLRAPVGLWGVICGLQIHLFRDGADTIFCHLDQRRADGANTH